MLKKKLLSLHQSGFTLIELVIVIVILGILSAVALPKFANISSDAKKASRNTLVAALKSAVDMTKLQCIVSSTCSETGDSSVVINGITISVRGGWPKALNSNTDGIQGMSDVTGYEITTSRNTVLYSLADDCTVQYHHPLQKRYPIIGGDDSCS